MEDQKFQLFTREGCIEADEILSFLKSNNYNVETVDVVTKEGFTLAQKKGILKLPTVLLLDKKGKSLDRLYILPEIKEIISQS